MKSILSLHKTSLCSRGMKCVVSQVKKKTGVSIRFQYSTLNMSCQWFSRTQWGLHKFWTPYKRTRIFSVSVSQTLNRNAVASFALGVSFEWVVSPFENATYNQQMLWSTFTPKLEPQAAARRKVACMQPILISVAYCHNFVSLLGFI
jgi:hypothetical protein